MVQVMTPKKDGSGRFCADYRNMNDCTEPASWPIGKGDEIDARTGSHKPMSTELICSYRFKCW
jgi:hypothetical protein